MGWIREAVRALAAGRELRVRPKGAWIDSRFSAEDELTLSPADPAAVQRGEIVFVRWKTNPALRLVLETRPGEIRIGKRRGDEGCWVPAEMILGRVTRIDKQYADRDPVDPEIRYQYLSTSWPLVEAEGDYRNATFEFRAKRGWWEFWLSPDPDYTPGDLRHLRERDQEALDPDDDWITDEEIAAARKLIARSGQYGKQGRPDVDDMSREEVLRIVRECIAEYASGASKAQ